MTPSTRPIDHARGHGPLGGDADSARRAELAAAAGLSVPDGSPEAVAEAYGAFLASFEWTWWASMTFRRAVSPVAADKTFTRWVHQLNRRSLGSRYYRRGEGLPWARTTELQRRGAVHFHTLIAGTRELGIQKAVADWACLAGDARIERYRLGGGAPYYMCKQLADGRGELDVGGDWNLITRRS